ncbi:MAG TPA: hypothetical protein VLJ61_19755 [Pyrinomonadaceae bacterium]|nr:hypothetical protein [Pyrinomonadaceae bacterium]
MRRRTIFLAAAVLAFVIGASLDYQLRRPGAIPDCFCTSAKCRLVFVADHTLISLNHPVEILDSLRTARWID